jgi:hypothetical protein
MGALRTIFGPALIAMAVVAGLAYLLSGDDDEFLEDPPPPKPVAAAPVEPLPPEPLPTPAAPPPAPPPTVAPPPVEPPSAPPENEAAPEAPDAQPAEPPSPTIPKAPLLPLPDKIRENALKMVGPAITGAMERGDLMQLKQLRGFFEQRKSENLLPQHDILAIDRAIACMEQAPEAREEAEDFLSLGRPSQFTEGLRKACGH